MTDRPAASPTVPRSCPAPWEPPWGQGPQSRGGPTEPRSPVRVTHPHTLTPRATVGPTPMTELRQLMRHFISHRIDWKADLPVEERYNEISRSDKNALEQERMRQG